MMEFGSGCLNTTPSFQLGTFKDWEGTFIATALFSHRHRTSVPKQDQTRVYNTSIEISDQASRFLNAREDVTSAGNFL
jgi:hypothetical protein